MGIILAIYKERRKFDFHENRVINIMKNKIGKIILYLVIFIILILSLTGCSQNNDNQVLEEKISTELSYLDTKLVEMLNKVNGISFENYIVKAEEISTESKSSEGSSNSQGESSSSSGEDSDSSGGETSSSQGGSSSGDSDQASKNNIKYSMEGNEILLQDRTPDWNTVKSEIEKLYNSWSTIVLDLYKVNVNNQDILSFNTDLDIATQSIKNEDKLASLSNLAKMYSYIPKYANSASKDAKINALYATKSNILNAYALIEQNNFNQFKTELVNAEQSFMPIINNISSTDNNQASINKAYILIKELQNINQNTDKDIFYIKYKNLMQELNNI